MGNLAIATNRHVVVVSGLLSSMLFRRTSLALPWGMVFRLPPHHPMSNKHKVLAAAATIFVAAGSPAAAQVPGSPVLQNAFSNPGLAVAANFGSGGGQSLFALAAAYGLGTGRLQISGAAGAQRANDATRGAYGARAAMTVWTSAGGGLGVGAFGGIGGAPRTRQDNVMTNPALMVIPVGLTAGYRRPFGASRGFSVYASPLYRWTRVNGDAGSASDGAFRGSVGLDVSVTPSLGATVGSEFGSSSSGASNFGVAISWVPGRR